MKISIKDKLCMPERAYPTSAGLDLKSSISIVVYPGEVQTIDTGISVQIPIGYVGLCCSRSGMGKVGVTLANSVGVIDAEYRGPLKLMISNKGTDPFHINQYDRIGQLLILPIAVTTIEIFEGSDEAWNDTERGHSGFGSTGKQ